MVKDVKYSAVVINLFKELQCLRDPEDQRREVLILIDQRQLPDGARIGKCVVVPTITVGEIGQNIFGREAGRVPETEALEDFGEVRVVEEFSAAKGFDFFYAGAEEELFGHFDFAAESRIAVKHEITGTEGAVVGIAFVAVPDWKEEESLGMEHRMISDLKSISLSVEDKM